MRVRRFGARSLRGALGAYTGVAVAALLLLAAALALVWTSPSFQPASVEVRLDPSCTGAVLRPHAGGPPLELTPDAPLHLPPGRWHVRLFTTGGAVHDQLLDLTRSQTLAAPR